MRRIYYNAIDLMLRTEIDRLADYMEKQHKYFERKREEVLRDKEQGIVKPISCYISKAAIEEKVEKAVALNKTIGELYADLETEVAAC